jgi:hypothetical protein
LTLALVLQWSFFRMGLWSVSLMGAAAILVGGLISRGMLAWMGRGRQRPLSPAEQESARMMGLALHGQGKLDAALAQFRGLPINDRLKDNLYHLAQDGERQRNLGVAKAAYEMILRRDRNYLDTRARHRRLRAYLHARANGSSSAAEGAESVLHPQSTPLLASGQVVPRPMMGRYELHAEIGQGAMGLVYLGRDTVSAQTVAIKTLALGREFEGRGLIDAKERFFREAQAAGRLKHPHIVAVVDAGEEAGVAYIAMEFLKGKDLSGASHVDRLLPIEQVVSIAVRVAEALDYAHAHQVVHRDIKPANIMFDALQDVVKVTDFGIARITDSSKTRTGLVLGTPSFMSPEQLAGRKVDGRSDLYSLGVTLFQLLTGELPLRGASMSELMQKIATEEAPDVRQLRPGLPAALALVVARVLQKRPEQRYQTGQQFAAELRQVAHAVDTPLDALGAVHYDAQREATKHEMADFQETVMEQSPLRSDAPASAPGAQ